MYRTESSQAIRGPLALPGWLWHNTSDMSRWARFIIAIFIGAVLGVIYGWFINPVEYTDTSPQKLRIDYKTDYVLMVSEAFEKDGDTALAVERLRLLGGKSPDVIVFEAIKFAQEKGYNSSDLKLMEELSNELEIFGRILVTPAADTDGEKETPEEEIQDG